jgi:parallel beta-helix repeat protein
MVSIRSGLRLAVLVVLCSAAAWPIPATASNTLNVPGNYPTIQSAIDAAANGDTVLVAPGTYAEGIDFKGKAITVTSAQGASVTAIDGSGLVRVVNFSGGEGRGSVLQGFTIQHGYAAGANGYSGAGIQVLSASPTLSGNSIVDNIACGSGAGVFVSFGSPLIQGNTISRNSQQLGCSGGNGGGVYVGGAASAQLLGNTISNNKNDFGGGIALFAAGTPTLSNNRVFGNTAGYYGGGVYAVNQSDASVVQNLIYANTAQLGGGMYFLPPSGTRGPQLVNNTFADNSVAAGGTGAALWAGGFDDRSSLYNNIFTAGQSTVYCDATYDATPPIFDHNDAFVIGGGSGYFDTCVGALGTSGNIAADPLFVSPANRDYHLSNGSAAIDAGNSSAPLLPATDLDGNARVEGAAVDIGVYEVPQPRANLSPASLDFGSQTGGTFTVASTTLTNTGNATLTVAGASLTGSSWFSVSADTCSAASLGPGASCSVSVRFYTGAPGSFAATLIFTDNAGSGSQSLPITGTALVGRPQFSPASISFGSVRVGRHSTPLTEIVTNVGNAPLHISAITVQGANASDYAIVSNSCLGAAVPAGGTCTVRVVFSPRATGTRSAAIVFASDDPAGPYSVLVSGRGTRR